MSWSVFTFIFRYWFIYAWWKNFQPPVIRLEQRMLLMRHAKKDEYFFHSFYLRYMEMDFIFTELFFACLSEKNPWHKNDWGKFMVNNVALAAGWTKNADNSKKREEKNWESTGRLNTRKSSVSKLPLASFLRPSHIRPAHIRPAHIRPAHIRPSHIRPSHIWLSHIRLSHWTSKNPGPEAERGKITLNEILEVEKKGKKTFR